MNLRSSHSSAETSFLPHDSTEFGWQDGKLESRHGRGARIISGPPSAQAGSPAGSFLRDAEQPITFKNYFRTDARRRSSIKHQPTLLKEFPAYIPPLPLQQKFAALVEQVERLRCGAARGVASGEHLFASLLDRAFSG